METPDALCMACAKVDLFSLFNGPRYFPGDGYENKISVSLGTLADVHANVSCPLCRLIKHDLYAIGDGFLWATKDDYVDPSKVQVTVRPVRADYREEMRYLDEKTRDKVATILEVRLSPLEGLSAKETDLVRHHDRGNGIQLLSPDSVDPARPLLNGYRATTIANSLDLLQKWMNTCVESHTLRSQRGTCSRPYFHSAAVEYGIRVIDVEHRTIVERNPEEIEYAALSYVWSTYSVEDAGATLQDQAITKAEATQGSSSTLPQKIPKVVEDAIFVCKKLAIPYLWVDRYCIDQSDRVRTASEIEGMGYRYHYAKLTLIAGSGPASDNESEIGLLPVSGSGGMEELQRVETVQERKYITSLPSIRSQLHGSPWIDRSWTMQEGQLSNRCAFFGNYDVSFLCGLGHWRESLHSGPYAHEAEIPDIEMECEGYYMLSWLSWRRGKPWKFEDYTSLLMSYTPRKVSFESDKLNAITGCLNFITEMKGVHFIYGLPATDFHYALLWTAGYDRSREGFPSWSWAGWHCLQQHHLVYPLQNGTCSLEEDGHGNLQTVGPIDRDVEMHGLFIALTEAPHRTNKCSQRFANIYFPSYKTNTLLTITSEIAHFSLDILPSPSKPEDWYWKSRHLKVPYDFDSTSTPSDKISWDLNSEYRTPFERLRLRDDYNNAHTHHYPRWYDHWPPFTINLPQTLRGDTIAWLLKEGMELIMIVEIELLSGDESLKPFHLVLCLVLDRRGDVAKRCGMCCLPKEFWDKSRPQMGSITLG